MDLTDLQVAVLPRLLPSLPTQALSILGSEQGGDQCGPLVWKLERIPLCLFVLFSKEKGEDSCDVHPWRPHSSWAEAGRVRCFQPFIYFLAHLSHFLAQSSCSTQVPRVASKLLK